MRYRQCHITSLSHCDLPEGRFMEMAGYGVAELYLGSALCVVRDRAKERGEPLSAGDTVLVTGIEKLDCLPLLVRSRLFTINSENWQHCDVWKLVSSGQRWAGKSEEEFGAEYVLISDREEVNDDA